MMEEPEVKRREKWHSVVYKNKLLSEDTDDSKKVQAELSAYYTDANRSAAFMSEFFLNLFGGITATDLQYARYKTTKKSKADGGDDEEVEEGRLDKPKVFPDAVLLFHNWFVLEDAKHSDEAIRCPIQDVMPQFLQYLQKENVKIDERWQEALQATVESATFVPGVGSQQVQDRVWVDRRRGHQRLMAKVGLSAATVKWLFTNPDFLLQEKEVDSHQFAIGFISNNLMIDGKKSDFEQVNRRALALKSFIKKTDITDPELLRVACCDLLGLKRTGLEAKDVSAFFGKSSGSPSGITYYLAGQKTLDKTKSAADQVLVLIDTQIGKADFRLRKPPDDAAWARVVDYWAKSCDLPFQANFMAEFAGMALCRIRSHRKNSLNTLVSRYTLDRRRPSIPTALAELIDRWCIDRDQLHLWSGDTDGLEVIQQLYTSSCKEAVLLMEKQGRHRRCNYSFLKQVAEYLDTQSTPLDLIPVILDYQVATKLECDFWRLRADRLPSFLNSPNHPQWGVSRPTVEYQGTKYWKTLKVRKKDVEVFQHTYRLQILTKTGVKDVVAETINKRAHKDLVAPAGYTLLSKEQVEALPVEQAEEVRSREVCRTSKLIAAANGQKLERLVPCLVVKNKKKATIEANAGVKLFKNEKGGLYLYLTFKLPSKLTLPMSELAKLQPGWKFMAFDPGIRTNISYCIGEVLGRQPASRGPSPYTDPKDGKVCIPVFQDEQGCWRVVKVIEVGVLREKDFTRSDSQQRRHALCRLESTVSSDTVTEAKEFWATLVKAEIATGDCPVKMTTFTKQAVGVLLRHTRKEDNPNPDLLKNLVDVLRFNSRNNGLLSYCRIKNFKMLKSLYQRFLKKSPQPWMEHGLQYVTDKIRNMRGERFRRIGNLVCQKAVEHKVKAVFPEKTELDVHGRAPAKWMAQNVDIWTPRRVLEQCGTQLDPLGIFVRRVESDYSSHKDFTTGELKPRWADLSVDEIKKEITYYQSLRRNMSKTTKVYHDEIGRWLCKHGCTWDNWQKTLCLKRGERFPRRYGPFFWVGTDEPGSPTGKFGWWDSDEQAAVFLLMRGIRNLLETGGPKRRPKPRPRPGRRAK